MESRFLSCENNIQWNQCVSVLQGLQSDRLLGTYHGLRRKHVDTYLEEFVFRYNRRFYRHVSFETMLGLAAGHEPVSYWDIAGRANPRKGDATIRQARRVAERRRLTCDRIARVTRKPTAKFSLLRSGAH